MIKRKGWIISVAFIVAWLAVVSIGLKHLWNYEVSAGSSGKPPLHWPQNSQIHRTEGQSTLVLLAHPHCPCTRATIGELSILMTHCQGKATAYVLFYKPVGFPDDWEQTDLWRSAASIPGVTVLVDNNGTEARLFGGATSGQALLYGKGGNLMFSGGITGGRGHSGDNAGRDAITSLLLDGAANHSSTPVFGCELLGKDVAANDKEACHATKP